MTEFESETESPWALEAETESPEFDPKPSNGMSEPLTSSVNVTAVPTAVSTGNPVDVTGAPTLLTVPAPADALATKISQQDEEMVLPDHKIDVETDYAELLCVDGDGSTTVGQFAEKLGLTVQELKEINVEKIGSM